MKALWLLQTSSLLLSAPHLRLGGQAWRAEALLPSSVPGGGGTEAPLSDLGSAAELELANHGGH